MKQKSILIFTLFLLHVQLLWGLPFNKDTTEVNVNEKHLYKDVEKLSSINPPRNYKYPDSLNDAAQYIYKIFEKCSQEVKIQKFKVKGIEYKNIIASFGVKKNERIIVGAHYDVCGDQPGADDNASGVAALLELARLFARNKPKFNKRIDLVAYTLEEPPFFRTTHMGSAIHAQSLVKKNVKVHLMISVDMIGFFSKNVKPHQYISPFIEPKTLAPGNNTLLLSKEGLEKIINRFIRLMSNHSKLNVITLYLPKDSLGVDFSDHLNYWQNDFPALMLTNFFICPNNSYHKHTDTIEKLDFKKISEIVRGLYFSLIKL